MMQNLGRGLIALFGLLIAGCLQTRLMAQDEIDFATQIRPLLSDRCYTCHGPDQNQRQADLRLDMPGAHLSGVAQSSERNVLQAGDAAASELFQRLVAEDDSRMPPRDSGLSLSATEVELIRAWIEQGATWDQHWSFQALPASVSLPVVDDASWSKNEIDAFVLAKLKSQSIQPAPAADNATLVRRLYLDLIGLPPTWEQLQRLSDLPADQCVENTIDELLQRPEFGERMASDWLDAARYSDTFGYQVDRDRFVWPWRDWVIRAFNQNMPYDQFLTEQLAGDLLPNATPDQILATTFNRLHPQKVEGGSVPEEFRIEYVADRTQTAATAFLGLTLECCRCHDHKYDPLSQRDYFAMNAFFDNIDEAGLYSYFTDSVPTPTLVLPDQDLDRQTQVLQQEIAAVELQIADSVQRIRRGQDWRDAPPAPGAEASDLALGEPEFWPGQIAFHDFENQSGHSETNGELVHKDPSENVFMFDAARGSQVVRMSGDEGIDLQVGNFPRWQAFSISLWIKTPDVKSRAVVLHRSRAWTDAGSRGYELLIEDGKLKWSLIHFWPGNAISIQATQTLPVERWVHVSVINDGSCRAAGLSIYMDGVLAESQIVRDALTKAITGGGGDSITLGERFRDRGFTGGWIDEVRVFDRPLSALELKRLANAPLDSSITFQEEAEVQAASGPQAVSQLWADHWAQHFSPRVKDQRQKLQQLRERLCQVQDRRQEIMVMRELSRPRPTYLLARGAYDAPTVEVEPDTPAAILAFAGDLPRNRLGLARWMLDRKNPLTARVAVNRIWQMLIGHGLVRTSEDFGNQGTPPTHPGLLDYLAIDFIDSGWDVKRLVRKIASSATYRQSIRATALDKQRDPENRWLGRSHIHRWPAETLRDQALSLSGLLKHHIGGPPTKPYDLSEAFTPSAPDSGDGQYRRSLYTYWKRTSPSPAMVALDAAKKDVCQVRRERTVTPSQSLVFLNSPQFVEASRALAVSVIQEANTQTPTDNRSRDAEPTQADPDDAEQSSATLVANRSADETRSADEIKILFRRMLLREADEQELKVLNQLRASQRERFQQDPAATMAYLSIGNLPNEIKSTDGEAKNTKSQPGQTAAADLASLTVLANTLFALEELTSRR